MRSSLRIRFLGKALWKQEKHISDRKSALAVVPVSLSALLMQSR